MYFLLQFLHRRCVSNEECIKKSNVFEQTFYKPHEGLCEPECPVGYAEREDNKHACYKCQGDCPKSRFSLFEKTCLNLRNLLTVCKSARIANMADVQKLKGCTVINGSLEININSGGNNIVTELEEILKDLTEITGYLKVARSNPLLTLNFLSNLRVIGGHTLERHA